MLYGVDHVGVATHSIEEIKEKFDELFNTGKSDIHDMPEDGIRILAYRGLNGKEDISFEVIAPIPKMDKTVISGFLRKKGTGVHHIAFRVGKGKLKQEIDRLEKLGFRFISGPKYSEVSGCDIVFIHPSSAGGILVELLDK